MSDSIDMGRLASAARPAVDQLLQIDDDDQLYQTLQMRRATIGEDPATAGEFALSATYDAPTMGALDDLRDFGKRYFQEVSSQIFGLVCGEDPQDDKVRSQLISAFSDKATFAALLASAIVTYLGLAPALAAVLAVIVVRLFFAPAYKVMCKMWGDSLKAGGAA